MKKRKFLRFLIIILTVLNLLILNNGSVYALSGIVGGAQNFINDGVRDSGPTISDGDLQDMSDILYNALLVIATIIAIIVGLVIAIQFMTGSVAEKAEVKKTLIPYIAGCIVIFGAFGIWKIVVDILSQSQLNRF